MNLSFRDIEYFLAVVDIGHMARAAVALGITQPALSKALRRLEIQTGLVLFNRDGRQLQLNASGIVFVEHARQLHTQYADAIRHTHALQAGQAGLLRIGATPVTLDTIVMSALSWLMPRRPALRISLAIGLSDDLFEQVINGQLDIAVAPTYIDTMPMLDSTTLKQDELVIVVRHGHPLLKKTRLQLRDTLQYRWILPMSSASARQRLLQGFIQQGLTAPSAAMEVPSISLGMLKTVANTDFISFAPVSTLLQQNTLGVEPLGLNVPTARKICLITRQGASWTPLMEAFRDAAIQDAEDDS